jgi:lysophospholipase L1-like esterase
MRIWALAALLLLGAAPLQDQALPLHIGGRVVADSAGWPRFGWPGVYFEARFEGNRVATAIETETELFRLLIDGKERARLGPDRKSASIEELGPGVHTVRLEKLTESQSGSSRFYGFVVAGDAKPLTPAPRRMGIEFIGDSHSVGYGDTSPKRECTQKEIHDTTDTSQAFGPLAAKSLNAEYRVIAYSGYGVVRNYGGAVPGDSLPKRYPRAIPGEEAPARPDGWQPDWVVIDLGSNDFSTPLHVGEAWKDADALHADYRASYAKFVRMLLGKYPKARIALVRYQLFDADVLAVAKAVGSPRVLSVEAPVFENTGCDWHPSLKDHRALAERVAAAIGRSR